MKTIFILIFSSYYTTAAFCSSTQAVEGAQTRHPDRSCLACIYHHQIIIMVLTQEEIDGCREAFLAFDRDRSGK